jgi:crotonobetainyl-CoA:carnitine CoA-transferase CaiB-like acyl-CoA transferase
MSQGKILAGVRILDFGRYIAAPYSASLLAGLGAEVVRIDGSGGNDDRFVMPITEQYGAMYLQMNRDKSSLVLNMQHEQAQSVIHRLVQGAHVVIANTIPSALKRAGLDYDTLKAIKPDIILANVTAYGPSGPQKNAIGFDGTGQSMSGAIHLSGLPGMPFRAAVSYVDYGTAFMTAFATLAAIMEHRQTGQGQEVSTSLLSTAMTMMNMMLLEEASGTRSRVPVGNRSPISAPSDLFPTKDRWIMVQVIGNAMFKRWTEIVGRPDLLDDPRFSDDLARGDNGVALSEAMSAWTSERGSEECLEALRRAKIPSCPVLTPSEALREPQNQEAGFLNWRHVPGWQHKLPFMSPYLMSEHTPDPAPSPALGQGSRAVLGSYGFSDAEIAALARDGVVELGADA